MRYLVRYFDGVDIINDMSTNDHDLAYKRLLHIKKEHPSYNVWIADIIAEIFAG